MAESIEMKINQADMHCESLKSASRKLKDDDLGWCFLLLASGLQATADAVGLLAKEVAVLKGQMRR